MNGQIIVLDKEKKVVAIVSDSEVVVNDEYQVIYDLKEKYRFIDCGDGVVRAVKEKNTPKGACEEKCSKCNCVNPPMPRFPGDNFGGKRASGPSMECPY